MSNSDGSDGFAFGTLKLSGVTIRRLVLGILVALGVAGVFGTWAFGRHEASIRERAYPIPAIQNAKPEEKALQVQAREVATAEAALEISIFQLALSVAGVFGVGFTIYYAHRAWREAERSSVAATASIEHLRVIERAYAYGTAVPSILKTMGQTTIDLDVRVSNHGKTPARIREVRCGVFPILAGGLVAHPTVPDYSQALLLLTDTIFGAGNENAIMTIDNMPLAGAAYGQILYDDVFGKRQFSRFFITYDAVKREVATIHSEPWNDCS